MTIFGMVYIYLILNSKSRVCFSFTHKNFVVLFYYVYLYFMHFVGPVQTHLGWCKMKLGQLKTKSEPVNFFIKTANTLSLGTLFEVIITYYFAL